MSKLTPEQTTVLAGLADYLLQLAMVPAELANVEDTPAGDMYDDMDRAALKQYIMTRELDITITKSMSDDAIREAIRAAAPGDETVAEEPVAEEPVDEPAEEEEAPAPKSKKGAKAQTVSAEDVDADEMEALRAAIKALIVKKGDAAAMAVLNKYKAKRISEIPEEKIADAIKAAKAALK